MNPVITLSIKEIKEGTKQNGEGWYRMTANNSADGRLRDFDVWLDEPIYNAVKKVFTPNKLLSFDATYVSYGRGGFYKLTGLHK